MEIRRGDSCQASILMLDISFAMPFSTRRPIIIIWKILEAAQATFQLIIIYTVLNELL